MIPDPSSLIVYITSTRVDLYSYQILIATQNFHGFFIFSVWNQSQTKRCKETKQNENTALHWRHNGRDSVSNHQPHGCLVTRLFRRRSKKNIKAPRHWPLCGEFTGTGEFPAQMASYAENVSIWWRHHESSGQWNEAVALAHMWHHSIFNSHIPRCIRQIYYTRAYFCYTVVHYGIWYWCIVWFVQQVYSPVELAAGHSWQCIRLFLRLK